MCEPCTCKSVTVPRPSGAQDDDCAHTLGSTFSPQKVLSTCPCHPHQRRTVQDEQAALLPAITAHLLRFVASNRFTRPRKSHRAVSINKEAPDLCCTSVVPRRADQEPHRPSENSRRRCTAQMKSMQLLGAVRMVHSGCLRFIAPVRGSPTNRRATAGPAKEEAATSATSNCVESTAFVMSNLPERAHATRRARMKVTSPVGECGLKPRTESLSKRSLCKFAASRTQPKNCLQIVGGRGNVFTMKLFREATPAGRQLKALGQDSGRELARSSPGCPPAPRSASETSQEFVQTWDPSP